MRKRMIPAVAIERPAESDEWIDLEEAAEIFMSSEDPLHPIEAALSPGSGRGWKANEPGRQTLRLIFDEPQQIRRIRLVFTEADRERTQEFVLRWSREMGGPSRDILRQQYHFSPGATEVEDYRVDLEGARIVELELIPSIEDPSVKASLAEWRVGR